MKKTKRDIHKEIMYNKIMPTSHSRKNFEEIIEDDVDIQFPFPDKADIIKPEISSDMKNENKSAVSEKNNDYSNKIDSENENIVKILSEYNEYKEKKSAVLNEKLSDNAEKILNDLTAKSAEKKEIPAEEKVTEDTKTIIEENIPSETDSKKEDNQETSKEITEKPEPAPEPQLPKLVNLKEKMIALKIDEILEKFNCCKCPSCKLEITSIALNRLSPMYIIAKNDADIDEHMTETDYSEITSALINAIITVRANPIHK